jgi:putative DNA primase/helicase
MQGAPNVLYGAWVEWCMANGRQQPGSLQTFGRDLKAAFPAIGISRERTNGDRVR